MHFLCLPIFADKIFSGPSPIFSRYRYYQHWLKVCVHLFNPSLGCALGSAIKCREVHPPYSSLQLIVLAPLSFVPLVPLTLLELVVISEGEGFFEIFVHCLPL